MQHDLRQLVEDKRLLLKTSDKIAKFNESEQKAMLDFIHDFKLGINYSREFIGYLLDISRRDGILISEILRDQEIISLSQNENLPHARKMELLREAMKKKRYAKSIDANAFTIPNIERAPKKNVYEKQKGSWLKRCPGTQGHICCNYMVINSISGCPFDCTYCYLRAYMNKPHITVYTNYENLINELKEFIKNNKGSHFRIGTGEFSDSLALDKNLNLSRRLIKLFAGQNEHLLELKTKSAQVDHLLNLKHCGRTIFAWSMNPEKIVISEELGTASLEERIKAAKKCVTAGYPVAFHFDPIIYYLGWDKDYKEVVDNIFSEIDPEKVAWMSLGALRYPPKMKDFIEARFPHSKITLGELGVGEDNKLRYFPEIRIELFKTMQSYIRYHSKEVFIYLCMESIDVWEKVVILNSKVNLYCNYFDYYVK